ncbi:MAG TPA: 4-hydroxy-tetrahydrodipicolinate synthase [Xanthobacteraceae bacterium]|nr:4-hydroxy-tetrahydrodipicolinate synthase [Xanthobacteraceae bacterium]
MPAPLTGPIARQHLSGLWLPLITPFRDGELDTSSLRRMIHHYAATAIDGLILGATTGEGLTLDEFEAEKLASICTAELNGARQRLPLFLGLAGSDTRKVATMIARTEAWPVDGYLISAPSYTRPSQEGLYRHFAALAEATARPIMLYNIPYRTAVNITNDTMLRLAAYSNIVGLKDCSADTLQSVDLLCRRPAAFSVLTGEDALFYSALSQGADGGILASAHVETAAFAQVAGHVRAGNQPAALAAWSMIADLPRLLFAEPSPAPIKYWLWRQGLIDSPEVRLPMTPVSAELASRIEQRMASELALAGA